MRLPFSAALVPILIGLFLIQNILSGLGDGPTSDEAVHLAAGYSYWITGDYRMNPEHPPLAKLLAAFPLWLSNVPLELENASWVDHLEWAFGVNFLYRSTWSPDVLMALGRAPIVLLGLATLLLFTGWAGKLYGREARWLPLLLLAFEPNFIAHSHYVTNDVALSFSFLLTLFGVSRLQTQRDWQSVLFVGIGLGLALASKFSGMLIGPWIFWGIFQHSRDLSGKARALSVIKSSLIVGFTAYIILFITYQGEPFVPYWNGIRGMQSAWNSYLLGEISSVGWYHYFVVCYLLKVPPATVLLLIAALMTMRRQNLRPGEGLLLSAAMMFFLVSSYFRINIGFRHILPIQPLLLLLTGRLLLPENVTAAFRRVKGAIPALGICTALEVGLSYPHYTAYFSSAVGGSYRGYRYLSDSNLDWGQDFLRVRQWMATEAPEGALMGVFSGVLFSRYNLHYQALPGFGAAGYSEKPLERLPDKLFVVLSAMNLQGVYMNSQYFETRTPIGPDVYQFLLERPTAVRLTPSIWIWDVSTDADALLRLGMLYLNFGWKQSAVPIFERYLRLNPADARTAQGLEVLKKSMVMPE